MPDPFDVGSMRHRVTVQARTDGDPEIGQAGDEAPAWEDVREQWARVEPLSGRELFNAQQIKATIDYRITMRVTGPLEPANRIVFAGRVFNIESVTRVDERNEFYQVLATQLRGETP